MATLKHSRLITYLESNFAEFSKDRSERLKALYSDFSKLWVLNKYAYDTNLNFWKRVILDSNQQGYLHASDYSLAIDKHTITDQFLRPIIGKPLSLNTPVIEHMEKEHELISLKDFHKKYAPSISWYDWVMGTVYTYWRSDQDDMEHELSIDIVLPTLKSIVKAILADHYEKEPLRRDDIMTLSQFKSKYAYRFFNDIELTDGDIHLVLKYLHSQHGIALANHIQGYSTYYMMIKFPQTENAIATITQHDKAIISIRTTCHALSVQVDELQKKAEQLSKEAVVEKSSGHIPKALYCLKRKKSLQEVLEKRLKSMETMETILLKIESSKDDLQVIQAFNMGADTLKSLIHYEGLDYKSVNDVMEKVQQALDDQKEIDEALQMQVDDNNTMIDEQDLEHELSELLKEEQQQQQQQQPEPSSSKQVLKDATNDKLEENKSELARLNQMFSSKVEKKKELAS